MHFSNLCMPLCSVYYLFGLTYSSLFFTGQCKLLLYISFENKIVVGQIENNLIKNEMFSQFL